MRGKTADLTYKAFNEVMADGNYVALEVARVHAKKGDEHFVTVRYDIFDKFDHWIATMDVWAPESPPPPGTTVIILATAPKGSENWQDGQVGQIDILETDGDVAGSLGGGLGVALNDVLAALAKTVPSDERYAYWVSLFNGDLTVTGSKNGDFGIEVGTGGTATVNSGNGDDLVRVWHQKNVVFNGGKGVDTISFTHSIGSGADAPTGAVVDLTAGTGINPFGGTLSFNNVENVTGVDDRANNLRGNSKANQLTGGHEADTIKGEGGDDSITIEENNTVGVARAGHRRWRR